MSEDKTTVRAARRAAPARPLEWQLVVTDGKSTGARFPVRLGESIIGRGEEAAIRLTDSGVSRQHAKLVFSSDGRVLLVDLESTNGTFVNGSRVEISALHAGSRLRIGPDAELRFEQVPEADAATLVDPLRPRELDVARLVAQGLTNPQIAERLGIRPRTVATHLENAYRRLGIGSRAELARHLSEAGLI